MKRALVTGASGFVGSQLARALCQRGDRVRCLVRATSDLARLDDLDVELCTGDVTDAASLERAVRGQQLVFHNAAAVGDWGEAGRFFAVNVEGTRNLVQACQAQQVERLLLTSSLTVLGIPQGGARVDEETPYAARPGHAYVASKIEAEQVVRASWDQVPATIVRPAAVWGPGDTLFFPRFERLARRGRMFFIGRGDNHVGMTHVDNLIRGLLLAAEADHAAGQIFHVTDGVDPTTGEVFTALAEALGVSPPRFGVPIGVLKAAASLSQLVARAARLRRPPLLTPYSLALLCCDGHYDIRKATALLGYGPAISFHAGVDNLAQWYRSSQRSQGDS